MTAKIGDVGTLRELDVKPGDVVEWIDADPAIWHNLPRHYTVTSKYYAVHNDGGTIGCTVRLRLISRATPQPTLWRDMTDEEKGALLLAAHEGKVIESYYDDDLGWIEFPKPNFRSDYIAYRVKPEPVRETVTLYGRPDVQWVLEPCDYDTHRITFNTLDGVPDCNSVKMEAI